MSDKALLPCPFCGSEASDSGMTTYSQPQDCWWEDGTPVTRAFFVNCLKCFATTQGLMGGQQTQEKAIAAWNTRVQSTSPGGAEEWRPIETAPYSQVVRVRVGGMTFLATLQPDAAMTSDEQSCDQWQAVIEGEHPPCWSCGCCWESNENQRPSLQPDAWHPAPAGR